VDPSHGRGDDDDKDEAHLQGDRSTGTRHASHRRLGARLPLAPRHSSGCHPCNPPSTSLLKSVGPHVARWHLWRGGRRLRLLADRKNRANDPSKVGQWGKAGFGRSSPSPCHRDPARFFGFGACIHLSSRVSCSCTPFRVAWWRTVSARLSPRRRSEAMPSRAASDAAHAVYRTTTANTRPSSSFDLVHSRPALPEAVGDCVTGV